MDLDAAIIGSRIKKRRKELRLTQLDMKEKTGVSSGNMSDIERGNRLPAAGTLVLLAEALQCSIDYLLTGKTPVQENTNRFDSDGPDEWERDFLKLLRKISEEDREELLLIAQLKYRRRKKDSKTSFPSAKRDSGIETA